MGRDRGKPGPPGVSRHRAACRSPRPPLRLPPGAGTRADCGTHDPIDPAGAGSVATCHGRRRGCGRRVARGVLKRARDFRFLADLRDAIGASPCVFLSIPYAAPCHGYEMAIPEQGCLSTDPEIGRSIRSRLILLVPVLLTFAGCMIGPDYQRPKVSISPSWGQTGDQRVSTESTTYRDWWRAFNDPVLDRLVARAYRDNLTLQQAGVRVLQARAQLGIAVGEVFPQTQQLIGSVEYNRTSDRAALGAAFGASAAYWQSQIGAQATWELDFWGRIRRGIESADA